MASEPKNPHPFLHGMGVEAFVACCGCSSLLLMMNVVVVFVDYGRGGGVVGHKVYCKFVKLWHREMMRNDNTTACLFVRAC